MLVPLQGRDLIIGNVGDSRAVLGTREKDNSLVAIQLTVDLKPNLPGISLIWEILAYFVEQWHQIEENVKISSSHFHEEHSLVEMCLLCY